MHVLSLYVAKNCASEVVVSSKKVGQNMGRSSAKITRLILVQRQKIAFNDHISKQKIIRKVMRHSKPAQDKLSPHVVPCLRSKSADRAPGRCL